MSEQEKNFEPFKVMWNGKGKGFDFTEFEKYEVVGEEPRTDSWRIIDDSGEAHVYPKSAFTIVEYNSTIWNKTMAERLKAHNALPESNTYQRIIEALAYGIKSNVSVSIAVRYYDGGYCYLSGTDTADGKRYYFLLTSPDENFPNTEKVNLHKFLSGVFLDESIDGMWIDPERESGAVFSRDMIGGLMDLYFYNGPLNEKKNVMSENLVQKAIAYAVEAHGKSEKPRKGTDIPYIVHPMDVFKIVSGMTSDEEVRAAAVLHDTIEDTEATYEFIMTNFSKRVANLVNAESEDKREGQPEGDTWKIRKQETISNLCTKSTDAQIICLGDKLANLRDIARDYKNLGESFWDRFNVPDDGKGTEGKKANYGWYYRSVADELRTRLGDTPEWHELSDLVADTFGLKEFKQFKVRYHGKSDPGYFIDGKEYLVVGESFDGHAWKVIDETGDWYSYERTPFEIIEKE